MTQHCVTSKTAERPLHHLTISELAKVIRDNWPNYKKNLNAQPYLDAMSEIKHINDMYYADTARDIVLYFLVNSGTWRGETARLVKAELRRRLDNK